MTTIRICEESDARLMIKDGSFIDYINMWSERFPQKNLLTHIKELHAKYGLKASDARMVADTMGADEDVIFEIGSNALLKKRNDKLTAYRRIKDLWVAVDDITEAFDYQPFITSLCEEGKILRAKSVKELAKSITVYLQRHWMRDVLLTFGEHEIWKVSNDNRILIYSHTPKEEFIFHTKEDIAEQIEHYRTEHKLHFS